MADLPEPFQNFGKDHPDVQAAYERLATAAHESGPLDEKCRRLVKLAIAVGGRLEGAVRSHARQARDAGVSDDEMDHVVMLALTTIGLPSAIAARTWIRSAIEEA